MKSKILLPIIFFIFSAAVLAQPQPRKIDFFGNTNCDDMRGRLDGLLMEIQKTSRSKGYVIVYEGKSRAFANNSRGFTRGYRYVSPLMGETTFVIEYFRSHLRFRNFSAESLIFVNGGYRESYTVELWLVPPAAQAPKPAPTLPDMKYRKGKAGPICTEM